MNHIIKLIYLFFNNFCHCVGVVGWNVVEKRRFLLLSGILG